MNEQQKAMLVQQQRLKKGAAIIEGTQEQFRLDGYTNMLNKYGTKQDNSTAYHYSQENITADLDLVRLYEGNGLFAKIIDRPAEESVKHGLDIDFGDEEVAEYIMDKLEDLGFEEHFGTAEKWSRLYGGSIIVMLVDDGCGLEEPLDWNNVRSIEELRVYERAIVQPDYTSLYNFHFVDSLGRRKSYAEPEYYQVFSIYGYFRVHSSRCLPFRNGKLPEQTTNAIYRYWGMPEYVKIKSALRECITSHKDGVLLLDRSVQAIYKMKNLANMLATADGEDKVIQRLQVIDMARGILNSIAIDTDGEDYDFKNLSLSGIKDVIDSTCNMLSAVTDIPQTILFGRSPAGMNATGESDLENYYNMVENIQKRNMKRNLRTLLDLIIKQGIVEGKIKEDPKYKVNFAPLWSMSEAEQANVEQTKAATEQAIAATEQIYVELSVLDPTEIRNRLAKEGKYGIEEETPDDELDIPEDVFDVNTPFTISGVDIGAKQGDDDDNVISIELEEDIDDTIEIEVETEVDSEEVIRIQTDHLDGGAGSGNWGHTGTPGKKGGSVTGGGIKHRIELEDGTYTSEAKKRMSKIVEERNKKSNGDVFQGAAVLIIHNGKLLCATRDDNTGVCGPGGKVEAGETPEEAAIREAQEEFNITPLNLIPLGEYKASSGQYLDSTVYFTDEFAGTPEADGDEMLNEQWLSIEELRKQKLFEPFEASIDMLENLMKNYLTPSKSTATITTEQNDGAPLRNKNAAGHHKKSYDKAIKGIKTSDGKTVKNIDPHMYKQAKARGVYPKSIATALSKGKTRPGNKGNRTVYSHNGTHVVFDNDKSLVKTVIYKGKS